MQSDKIRCSNFELLRIVAMFLVFAVHANFLALGQPTASEVSQSLISSFCRIFFSPNRAGMCQSVCLNLWIFWYTSNDSECVQLAVRGNVLAGSIVDCWTSRYGIRSVSSSAMQGMVRRHIFRTDAYCTVD